MKNYKNWKFRIKNKAKRMALIFQFNLRFLRLEFDFLNFLVTNK